MTQNSFPKIEEEILKFWQERQIFKKSLESHAGKSQPASSAGKFIFYDGPPFATGVPHYGHIIASAIKDVIPRYKTMRGYKANRRWGWDCHGLPIENLIEKELGLKTKKDIEKLGIDKFNALCQKSVLRYADEWKKFIPRMARWVDMEQDYRTMDNRYIEVIWWIFKELYKDGLIYEGYKPMHLCPRCETTLSNFEVTLGYKEVKDLSVYVKFKVKSEKLTCLIGSPPKRRKVKSISQKSNVYLLAWTTTPWTLPGTLALAVGNSIKYQIIKVKSQKSKVKSTSQKVKVEDDYEYYILARDRVKDVMKDKDYEIIGRIKGLDLVGLEWEPLFDFTFEEAKNDKNFEYAFKVYSADFVSTEDGTSIVTIAPAFGENDYQLSQKHQIPFLQHVNRDGSFKDYVKPWAGQKVREKDDEQKINIEIIKWLAAHDQLFAKEKYAHSYPHCWRCDTPLLNYAASSWFVRIDDDFKKRLLAANDKVNWVPKHLKDGRFGKWLEGARDWAISRSRYWGAPIPVWKCEDSKCGEVLIIGSVEELQEKLKTQNLKLFDLHRPDIDEIVLNCQKCGGQMRRIKEVFDCWFESGSMPYASEIIFSDFELTPQTTRQDILNKISFPADFIAEGIDQTRGWFYTLLVLGVALYDASPFKNVAVNGIILAEDGQKMSKRLKNYPDPNNIINKYGADALRFYLLSSPAVRGESLNFSEKGVDEVYKKVILLVLNVLKFWKTYTDDNIVMVSPENFLDKWIIARLKGLTNEVTTALDAYEIDKVCRPIAEFINDLSTWYLRRSRERFKSNQEDDRKAVIYILGAYALRKLSKIMAPITPFLSEYVYREVELIIGGEGQLESVHLEQWPQDNMNEDEDQKLLEVMKEIRIICEIGHSLRSEAGIKVRQALREFKIQNSKFKIKEKIIALQLYSFTALIQDELNVKEVEIVDQLPKGEGWISKDGVALYTVIDEELKEEGIVRELTRQINNLRRKQGLTIEDKIRLEYATESEHLRQIIEKYQQNLKQAVLVREIVLSQDSLEGERVVVEGSEVVMKLGN